MTSIASSKGAVGAEMLSSQIGAYFDQAIRIIEYHGGDVIKFLGDALLVVFQAVPDPDHINGNASPSLSDDESTVASELRVKKITVRKAVQCGLELLSRLSNYRMYLSEREYSRKLSVTDNNNNISAPEGSSGTKNSGETIGAVNGGGFSSGTYPPGGPLIAAATAAIAAGTAAGIAAGAGGSSSDQAAAHVNGSSHGPSNIIQDNSNGSASGGLLGAAAEGGGGGGSAHLDDGSGESGYLQVPAKSSSSSRRPSVGQSSVAPGTPKLSPTLNSLQRKREDSLSSHGSRPASTTSHHNRATALFNHAKNKLLGTGNYSDRHNVVVAETPEDSHELQLHMAMMAGEINNIIIGDLGADDGLNNLLLQTTGRLEYAICGEQMSAIDEALAMARAGELTITRSAMRYISPDYFPEAACESRRNVMILRNLHMNNDHYPLLRKIRNDKLFATSVESNPHYYKYINKSAIHRLMLYPDSNFPAQFRNATILFVSLGNVKPWTSSGLDICQRTMSVVHEVTSEYEGFIQQFAVDDKGATLLCAFGLPYPRSHEREALFAAKSAWVIRRRLLEAEIKDFKISLATGIIFTSMIGNEFRRDPAIVGDTIVIAVRILKFDYATESVVCDDATKVACSSDHDGLCEFEDMGEEFVKGKAFPIRIWKLVHFGAKKQVRRARDFMVDETVGYEPERERVAQFIKKWDAAPDHHTIVVTGPRGSGKSMFYQQICRVSDQSHYSICSAAGAEVEKNTWYYLCKFLLLGLFDIMRKPSIPYSSQVKDLGITFGNEDTGQMSATTTATSISTSASAFAGDDEPMTPISSAVATPSMSPNLSFSAGPNFLASVPHVVAPNQDLSLSPLTSYTPYGPEPSKRSSAYVSKLQNLISVTLHKAGESEHLVPRLHNIVSAIFADNAAQVMTDDDDVLLKDFIVKILNYADQFVRVVTMFEDVQWCDHKSLGVLQAMHDRCPNVLLVIFSRPLRDYCGNILQEITDHPMHLEIILDGLKPREIEAVLLRAFKNHGVTKISPDVIRLVQEKTKGNPKFVKSMANMLKDFCHVNIVDGELLTTGQEVSQSTTTYKAMEEMLVKQDRKKMILMQYDRVPPKFQQFLNIASCIGEISETFSLAEIAAVHSLEQMLGTPQPGQSFPTIISDLDTYRFLGLATDQQANCQFADSGVLNTIYTFSSPSTAKDIYESIPYEERVQNHRTLAHFYEQWLKPMNQQDLLPRITHHYLKTDCTQEKIEYLQDLAAFDLKSNMLQDATQSLTDLIYILTYDKGAHELISEEDLAHIYGMMGESLSKRMRLVEAEPALLDSMHRYGVRWPRTARQWAWELVREKAKFRFHYRGGATPGLSPTGQALRSKLDPQTQQTLERIIRVLGCLQNIYFWRTEPDAAMLSTLLTLNYCRKLGRPTPEQTVSLGRYALLSFLLGDKRSYREFIVKARMLDKVCDVSTEGMLPVMQAYVSYCEGDQEHAHQLLVEAINDSKTFGVVSNLATFYRSVTFKCSLRMWEGCFGHPDDVGLLRALSAVAIANGDTEGEALFAIPTLANLLIQDRLRDAESWIALIERYILPNSRQMNLVVIYGMLAYYYAKIAHFSKSRIYCKLMAEQVQNLGVGAHPFPAMGCTFTIMAKYEMLEHGCLVIIAANESDPTAKTDEVLKPVMQYLEHDPMLCISLPFYHLAEALRFFISHGDNKEGLQRLLRGWDKVNDLTVGVHFVRAYYLTKLCRHSEKADCEEYYSEAFHLFEAMGVDPAVWLSNPNSNWNPCRLAVENDPAKFVMGAGAAPQNTNIILPSSASVCAKTGGAGGGGCNNSGSNSVGGHARHASTSSTVGGSRGPSTGAGTGTSTSASSSSIGGGIGNGGGGSSTCSVVGLSRGQIPNLGKLSASLLTGSSPHGSGQLSPPPPPDLPPLPPNFADLVSMGFGSATMAAAAAAASVSTGSPSLDATPPNVGTPDGADVVGSS
ncbi:hypothetical protein DFQ27_000031 [Actinomortierella ambigua]|uniref:Guanylate cyclase domain-containing protein n=1 Tax=Actinomortierella ambigua TaxID=1343610 RepID=A0A9P6UCF3_9FUNG|nr:hypothetical protein DFQ27_000031 [Actinomortierella ambigua]